MKVWVILELFSVCLFRIICCNIMLYLKLHPVYIMSLTSIRHYIIIKSVIYSLVNYSDIPVPHIQHPSFWQYIDITRHLFVDKTYTVKDNDLLSLTISKDSLWPGEFFSKSTLLPFIHPSVYFPTVYSVPG